MIVGTCGRMSPVILTLSLVSVSRNMPGCSPVLLRVGVVRRVDGCSAAGVPQHSTTSLQSRSAGVCLRLVDATRSSAASS